MDKKNISILLLGPSGAGKGTQARLLSEKYGLKHLQSGDLLRNLAAQENDFGRQVKAAMQQGFVPSEWILQMMEEEFSRLDEQGVVIDGFSRKLSEIEMLYQVLEKRGRKLDYIFLIDLPDDLVIERLTNRRVCRACKSVFDVRSLASDVCPKCDGEVYQREDDNCESIRRRLADFKTETSQVIEFIRSRDSIIELDGNDSVSNVFEKICAQVEN